MKLKSIFIIVCMLAFCYVRSSFGSTIFIEGYEYSKSNVNEFRGMPEPSVSPIGKCRLYYDSTADKLKLSENGGVYSDIGGGSAPEGTDVLSTGEEGGSKYLREDGDGTCSWQAPAGAGDMEAADWDGDSNNSIDVDAGGTNLTSYTPYSIHWSSSADTFNEIGIGLTLHLLRVNAGVDGYEWVAPTNTFTAGTNLSWAGTTLNVDDAFLKNNEDDITSGKLTARDIEATYGVKSSTIVVSGTVGIGVSSVNTDYGIDILLNGSKRGINYTNTVGDGETGYASYNTLSTGAGTASSARKVYGRYVSFLQTANGVGGAVPNIGYGDYFNINATGNYNTVYGRYNNIEAMGGTNTEFIGAYNAVASTSAITSGTFRGRKDLVYGALLYGSDSHLFTTTTAYGLHTYLYATDDATTETLYGHCVRMRTYAGASDVGYGFNYEICCTSDGGTQYGAMIDADYATPLLDNFYGVYIKGGLLSVNTAKWGLYVEDLDSYFGGDISVDGGDIKCAADLTLDPAGNDVILDNAHLTVQSGYAIKHLGTGDYYTQLVNNDTDTGWFWEGTYDQLIYKDNGGSKVVFGNESLTVYDGIRIGSWQQNYRVNDSSSGSGTITMYIGTHTIDVTAPSDERFKKNIINTKYGLTDLLAITIKDFQYEKEIMADDSTVHTGIIAQELQGTYPYAVNDRPWGEVEIECEEKEAKDEEGKVKEKYKKKDDKYYRLEPKYDSRLSVDYKRLIPLMIKSIKELNAKVEENEKEIARLKNKNAGFISITNLIIGLIVTGVLLLFGKKIKRSCGL